VWKLLNRKVGVSNIKQVAPELPKGPLLDVADLREETSPESRESRTKGYRPTSPTTPSRIAASPSSKISAGRGRQAWSGEPNFQIDTLREAGDVSRAIEESLEEPSIGNAASMPLALVPLTETALPSSLHPFVNSAEGETGPLQSGLLKPQAPKPAPLPPSLPGAPVPQQEGSSSSSIGARGVVLVAPEAVRINKRDVDPLSVNRLRETAGSGLNQPQAVRVKKKVVSSSPSKNPAAFSAGSELAREADDDAVLVEAPAHAELEPTAPPSSPIKLQLPQPVFDAVSSRPASAASRTRVVSTVAKQSSKQTPRVTPRVVVRPKEGVVDARHSDLPRAASKTSKSGTAGVRSASLEEQERKSATGVASRTRVAARSLEPVRAGARPVASTPRVVLSTSKVVASTPRVVARASSRPPLPAPVVRNQETPSMIVQAAPPRLQPPKRVTPRAVASQPLARRDNVQHGQ